MIRRQRYGYEAAVPVRLYRRAPARRRYRPEDRVAIAAGALILMAIVGIALLAMVAYAYFTAFELVAPGVRVGGVEVGGLDAVQAAAALREQWASRLSVNLAAGSRTWPAAPATLGFTIDAEASARRAVQAGRGLGGWLDPLALLGSAAREVAPAVTLDEAAARKQLSAAQRIDIAPVEAGVRFQDGHWAAAPGKNGQSVDIEATLALWRTDPGRLLALGLLPLKMTAVAPRVMDASAEAARLEGMLAAPLKVTAYDPVTNETFAWQAGPAEIAPWVRVDPGASGAAAMQLDPAGFAAWLQSAAGSLGADRYLPDPGLDAAALAAAWQSGQPVHLRVLHHPTSYTVQAGDNLVSIAFKTGLTWWRIRDANPGVNPNALSAGQVITIPSKDDNLPLPVVENKRIVISITRQRLWTYENGQQRTESVISTGIARSPTQPGVWQIQTHDPNAYASNWDLWMPNFMGIYEAAPGFMNGIHGLPLLSSGVRLWANVLGQPASYGCIILTLPEAEDLYNWAENGVVVEIQP